MLKVPIPSVQEAHGVGAVASDKAPVIVVGEDRNQPGRLVEQVPELLVVASLGDLAPSLGLIGSSPFN
ncbi:MAG: hypothetical protein ACHQFZ_06650 [Acidimicrobiales bacterium]